MKEIERRIYVSEEIVNNEHSYYYGENKDKEVTFAYYHVKKNTDKLIRFKNYQEALAFARCRANDKRYRNFEFFIC